MTAYSKNIKEQKEQEKRDFELFKQLYSEMPLGEIEDNRENPDFIIKCDSGESLGVEHTELFKKGSNDKKASSQQEQWSLKYKVIQRVLDSVKDKIEPLHVNIWFRKNCNIKVNELTNTLEQFILNWYSQEHPTSQTFRYPKAIPEIYRISIEHLPGLPGHQWVVPEIDWAKHLIKDLESRIKEKKQKYNEYVKNCSRCWLLITFDKWIPSQMFEIPKNINEHSFNSNFEKLFLLERSDKELIELQALKRDK